MIFPFPAPFGHRDSTPRTTILLMTIVMLNPRTNSSIGGTAESQGYIETESCSRPIGFGNLSSEINIISLFSTGARPTIPCCLYILIQLFNAVSLRPNDFIGRDGFSPCIYHCTASILSFRMNLGGRPINNYPPLTVYLLHCPFGGEQITAPSYWSVCV